MGKGLVLFCLLLAGCGGGGGVAPATTPFSGQWSGNYGAGPGDTPWQVVMTVDPTGKAVGTVYEHRHGDISLTMTPAGGVEGYYQFAGTAQIPLMGTCEIIPGGDLVMNLHRLDANQALYYRCSRL